jgi:hypothetical protein
MNAKFVNFDNFDNQSQASDCHPNQVVQSLIG